MAANRKAGRNKNRCAQYRASGRRETNKARRAEKQTRRHEQRAPIRAKKQIQQRLDADRRRAEELKYETVELKDGTLGVVMSYEVNHDLEFVLILRGESGLDFEAGLDDVAGFSYVELDIPGWD